MTKYHIPVLKQEAIELLNINPNSWYIDCNLGGGGHTQAILEAGGNVLAIDLDSDAISYTANQLSEYLDHGRLILVQDNFANLTQILLLHQIIPQGILYDLGVSSHQLETSHRGFSFNTEGPLDMRMDPSSGIPAADLVNGLHQKELADLFWKLGEERFSRQIAKAIVNFRQQQLITTTKQLSQIILSIHKRASKDHTHPATRIFQALRIAVNDELNSLKTSLPSAFQHLPPHGRIVTISFHSLEDRIIKNFFTDLTEQHLAINLTKKPLSPTQDEILTNPRSRSSKLRAIEKI